MDTLIQVIRIYDQDIRMEFGFENRAMLIMKSGKRGLVLVGCFTAYQPFSGHLTLN